MFVIDSPIDMIGNTVIPAISMRITDTERGKVWWCYYTDINWSHTFRALEKLRKEEEADEFYNKMMGNEDE